MSFVGVTQLEVYYGQIDDDAERVKAGKLIEQAEARIRRDGGLTVDALIAADRTDPILAEQAVCEMVMAVLRNPECNVSSSETVGGLSESRTLNLAAASGLLRLTDDQRALLGIDTASRGGAAFTISPGGMGTPRRALDTSWG